MLAPVVVPAEQSDVIEIVGVRADQALKIDRRTYQVQQTPHSAQKDSFQLLRGLPAVTIGPDDTINLLGAPNVKVLVDGHENHTNLHTLHGSDIDRIEIITNPSAQYSSEGTGGIINLVLRKKRAEGLSGNGSIETSSHGRGSWDSTIKYRKGKWTYELGTGGAAGAWSRSTYRKRRSVEQARGAPATINTEEGGGPASDHGGNLRLKAGYDLDDKTNLSVQGFGGEEIYGSRNHARFTGITPDFPSFSQREDDRGRATFFGVLATFDHKGSRDGETLTGSFNLFGNPTDHAVTDAALSNGSSFRSIRDLRTLYSQNKIDWQHPIRKTQILSLGAEWNYRKVSQHYRFSSSDASSFGSDSSDSYHSSQSTFATYVTFQQHFGSWTIMPGLRVEQTARHIRSPALADVRIHRTIASPTFHADHPFGNSTNLTLSYSKRIDRPQTEQLRPYPVQLGTLAVAQGNPRLRDQSTDAFEANLHYRHKKLEAGLIIYDRETRRLISESYVVNSLGQNVSTFVNAGRRKDRGAELDVNAPILPHLKASISVNLFESRVPTDAVFSNAADERVRFTTNSTLEWDGPDRRRKPGDVAQLVWHYESPSTDFQFRNFGWHELTLTYTHNWTRSISLTATADSGALHYGHRLIAPLVQELYSVRRRPEFRLKLMKTFGKP